MINDRTNTSDKTKGPMAHESVVDIAPGAMEIIATCGLLRTVVGSGVSVCLFDFPNRIAGMNHFLFPRTDDPRKATGRYGNAALIGLLRMFERNYPSVTPLAYIIGGAYCDEFEIDAAVDNIRIAWKFLYVKQIPVVAQHIGGRYAREALFDVGTAEFTVREIGNSGDCRQ
jgi:chemotaxis protein CheD